MFDEISDKLKRIAKILFIAMIVLAGLMVVLGLMVLSEDSALTVGIIIGSAVMVGGGYVACAQLYGFAEIIDNTSDVVGEIAESNKRLANVAETNSRIVNVVAKSLPEILQTLEEQPKRQENA